MSIACTQQETQAAATTEAQARCLGLQECCGVFVFFLAARFGVSEFCNTSVDVKARNSKRHLAKLSISNGGLTQKPEDVVAYFPSTC